MGAQHTAPRYLGSEDYARRYGVELDEFFAVAALAPNILPEIIGMAGRLRIRDAKPIGGPALRLAREWGGDEADAPRACIPVSDFCREYGLDHETILKLAFAGKLPRPLRASWDATVALLRREDVRLWELAQRGDVAGG